MDKKEKQTVEIEESGEKYKNLVKNVPGMIYIGRSDWTAEIIKGSNEICGYSVKDFNSGKIKWVDLIHPEDKKIIFQEGNNLVKKPMEILQIYRIIAKDKSVKWVKDRKFSFFKNGKFVNIYGIVFDITSEKIIQEKLRESEEKIRSIFDNTNDSIFIHNYEGKILEVNNTACKKLGYTKKELLHLSPQKIDSPRFAKNVPLRIKEVQKNGSSIFETAHVTKTGEEIPMEVNAKSIEFEGQNAIISICRDITFRKKVEEELLKSKENIEKQVKERTEELNKQKIFYNSIVENIPDMVFVKDAKEFKFEEMNRAGELLLGLNKNKILGKNLLEKFSKSQSEFFLAKDREVIKERKLLDIPQEFIDTPHGTRILHTKKIPIYDENGKPKYLLGISEDITSRKKAEEELRKTKEKYQQLFEYSQDALMTLEPPKWNFTSGNPAALKMFGASNEKKFISFAPSDLSPEKQPDGQPSTLKSKAMIELAMKNGSNYFEWMHKKYKGQCFPATVLLSRIKEGNRVYLQATVRDISLRKQAEEKIKESYLKLKEADELKSKFLTVTSHELKTPLTPAKIQTQMLLQGDLGPLNEKQKESFEIVLRNINRLNKLIGDILEISSLSSEGFKLHLEKAQLKDVIQSVVDNMGSVARAKNLYLNVKLDNPPILNIDVKRMTEVITNLLDNAIKFTDKGGIMIEVKKQRGEVLVKISDTGVGMPSGAFEKLFQPFYQIESTFTRQHGGTGLGLSICRRIIEQHRGKIWVKSKLGLGSTFYFTLPTHLKKEKLK